MKLLCFDTETDSLINNTLVRQEMWPRIIEFCGKVIDTESLSVVNGMTSLVNPVRKISKEITDITSITNEMVQDQPRIIDLLPSIKTLIEGSDIVIAHNLNFDKVVIDLEAKRVGFPEINWPRLFCTVEATLHYKARRMKLNELHEHLLGEPFSGAHRAEVDVDALVRIVQELWRRDEVD